MSFEPIDPATQEPLDDEERELMDPDAWDWDNPIEGRTVGTPGAILEIRLTREEYVACRALPVPRESQRTSS